MVVPSSVIRDTPPTEFSQKICILAPMSGTLVSVGDAHSSPIARTRLLGEGVSLRSASTQLLSPFSAKVAACPAIGYQISLLHATGLRVDLSFGSQTHRLMGERCVRKVKTGQRIKAGTPLLTFDPLWLKQQGVEPVCTISVAANARIQALVISPLKRFIAMEDVVFTLYLCQD